MPRVPGKTTDAQIARDNPKWQRPRTYPIGQRQGKHNSEATDQLPGALAKRREVLLT